MMLLRVKYRTKVMDGSETEFQDCISTMTAMAFEAEAQSQRFLWSSPDGLGMALEYKNIVSLFINGREVSPINKENVSSLLFSDILPPCPFPPCPFPPTDPTALFVVFIASDNGSVKHFSSSFLPGSHFLAHPGENSSFMIKMENGAILDSVFANGVKLYPNASSEYPNFIFTITAISSNMFVKVEYHTEQES